MLSPQITISITMQMDTCMQFYLNVLPFFAHCIVMVPLCSVSILLHSGTNTCSYSEWEIVIWLIEADFFQYSFFFCCETLNDVIIFVSIIYIFFSLPVSNSKRSTLFGLRSVHGSFTVKNVKIFMLWVFIFFVSERWIYFPENSY